MAVLHFYRNGAKRYQNTLSLKTKMSCKNIKRQKAFIQSMIHAFVANKLRITKPFYILYND